MTLRQAVLGKKRSSQRSGWGRAFRQMILGVTLLGAVGFGYQQVESLWQKPQAVLVLGGATEREEFAAEFAQTHPHLQIWVSSGSNPEYAEWVFSEAGIPADRVHLDYQAVDTVTNFTTLVDMLKAQGITSVYLITSDYHMRRAQVIGEIILGSRGIDFKPIAVPSHEANEPIEKVVRDAARAVLWVTTGNTGADWLQRWKHPIH
ncbi:YdcF family protein [Leptolyngbya sp. FACHB-711]|uniref:YdcF family protein n=1 Tax=unclassified Leptolyngbya TaxID=2650499 RepID=UPI0016899E68|nr:YdcF family protein [Leptolyngbya sp. FACHB-711]MBD1851101.1 YdcF family protein [Cyanobacteria bacterium FACHB-502]MBD2027969.1 YdcF family protein [Leptolyngbya sp. FACHB-711]